MSFEVRGEDKKKRGLAFRVFLRAMMPQRVIEHASFDGA
jgi:hypothetical protein